MEAASPNGELAELAKLFLRYSQRVEYISLASVGSGGLFVFGIHLPALS